MIIGEGRASSINGRQQTYRTAGQTRKHTQQETTYVTMEKGRVSNLTETRERGLDRPAVGGYRYWSDRSGYARLGVEDDCDCGSRDEAQP